MSLFTSMLQPVLERELKSLEPEMCSLLLTIMKKLSTEALEWAETKINTDLNKDGTIGEPKNEA